MNAPRKPTHPWRTIAWLIALILIVAYALLETHLEDFLGVDLPSIRQDQSKQVADGGGRDSSPSGQRQPETAPGPAPTFQSKFLKPLGKLDRWQSPAGLIYGRGAAGEHRLDHVMRHAQDDPTRPVHSVFVGTQDEILSVIDEAYQLILSKSNRAACQPDPRLDFRVQYVVDLQRKVGFLGGKRGRREKFPPCRKLTLVLDNQKFVVTAYPSR